jgi:EpsI family protein
MRWKQASRGVADVPFDAIATPPKVRSATLRGPRPLDGLAVWQWYWIGDTATASDLRGKLELARARLLRQSDTGLWVAVYVPLREDGAAAEQILRSFVLDMGPSLRDAFDEMTAQ